MKKDVIIEKYVAMCEAKIGDSSVDDDSNYHIFDKNYHEDMKSHFNNSKKISPEISLNSSPIHMRNSEVSYYKGAKLNPHYAGSFGLHIDSDEKYYNQSNKSFVKFHSIHKDHAFLTEEPDGNYKIHSDYSKPIEFNSYRTHGLIPKDMIKDAIKIPGKEYAKDPDKHSLHDPNKITAVFSITDI